jgi:hypothetical protein
VPKNRFDRFTKENKQVEITMTLFDLGINTDYNNKFPFNKIAHYHNPAW